MRQFFPQAGLPAAALLAMLSAGCAASRDVTGSSPPPPTLSQVILTPATVSLGTGATQQFTVSGKLSDGSTVTPAVTYAATGGSITTGGLYTAGTTAGTFRVIATQQGGTLADTSGVTLTTSPPPTLTQVILTPATVTLAPSATQQFTVSGKMSDGSTVTPAVTYSATGGTITTGGLYTAGSSAGSFRVIATQQGGTLADTAAVTIALGRSYTTTFPLTENPISEGGNWINGGTVGLDWTNVSTTPGLAIGHEVGALFTDATALLTGTWGPNQQVSATVHSVNQNDGCYQEVELRLRSALSAHVSTGYEVMFKASQTSQAYVAIARWNGALGNFTQLGVQNGAQYGVKTGDVVMATIVGNVITAYKNGVQVLQVTDNTFTSGAPGMGFNLDNGPSYPGCSGTNGDYGFTSLTAMDTP
jgi:hypothetical protein